MKLSLFIIRNQLRSRSSAFTLIELMVSVAVIALLMTLVMQVLNTVQRSWRMANSRVAQFREARRALDRITYNLSQASLNQYLAYLYSGAGGGGLSQSPPAGITPSAPKAYMRYSELQFTSGTPANLFNGDPDKNPGHALFFQAPLGTANGAVQISGSLSGVRLPTALNPCGYFINYDSDQNYRPVFLNSTIVPARYGYRLMEFRPPTHENLIYDSTRRDQPKFWFDNPLNPSKTQSHPVADNIILVLFSPKRPLHDGNASTPVAEPRDIAPNYSWSSLPTSLAVTQGTQDHQLPPLVEVTLVALDAPSAAQVSTTSTPPFSFMSSLFTTANEQQYLTDIKAVEQELSTRRLNYRIFTATVALKNSKWIP